MRYYFLLIVILAILFPMWAVIAICAMWLHSAKV